ncbi:hypothetical protein AKO1_007965 [Acrasis kona]|uniref:Uncharacterized protein n=1 Tax=Acrasis kona TaxID=1008807 RepID=A0AAW2YP19_9EUKA
MLKCKIDEYYVGGYGCVSLHEDAVNNVQVYNFVAPNDYLFYSFHIALPYLINVNVSVSGMSWRGIDANVLPSHALDTRSNVPCVDGQHVTHFIMGGSSVQIAIRSSIPFTRSNQFIATFIEEDGKEVWFSKNVLTDDTRLVRYSTPVVPDLSYYIMAPFAFSQLCSSTVNIEASGSQIGNVQLVFSNNTIIMAINCLQPNQVNNKCSFYVPNLPKSGFIIIKYVTKGPYEATISLT